MKSQHNVEPFIVFKAALALLNVAQTGQSNALFANYQAARTWPFVEERIQRALPDPMDISGPTFEVAINCLAVPLEDTIGDFLSSVARDQTILTRWAHTPLRTLQDSLGKEDGEMVLEIIRRQIFNWLPIPQQGAMGKERKLAKLQTLSRSDVGVLFNCGMTDAETFWMNASYNDAQLSAAEVTGILDKYFAIAEWIADPQHYSEILRSAMGDS